MKSVTAPGKSLNFENPQTKNIEKTNTENTIKEQTNGVSSHSSENIKVGIIGGGLMGMTLAYKVSQLGASVTVFERDSQLGGLSTHHNYGNFTWDKFYHVIVPTDGSLIGLITDIGLEDQLNWSRSLTGYYVDNKFHSLNSPKEFLLFPLLNLWDKFRLALTIFYGGRISNWKKLETTTVRDWLVRMGGERNFEKFWKPLLLAKLGENYKRVSAVFIWTYIRRLFKSREHPVEKDFMGYVSGGYKTVFDRLHELITKENSNVLLGATVSSIKPVTNGGILINYDDKEERFDKVIFTGPTNVLERVTSPEIIEITGNPANIEYLGVICMILVTKKPLTPFYVLNMGDVSSPFTGVIGISSLVDTKQTAGEYITYFPKYIPSEHPYWKMTDGEIREKFMAGVHELYPDLKNEDLIATHINRAFKVQPLQVLNYSSLIPKFETKHPNYFVLNTSQFVNDSVNNNALVAHVNNFVKHFELELSKRTKTDTTNEIDQTNSQPVH